MKRISEQKYPVKICFNIRLLTLNFITCLEANVLFCLVHWRYNEVCSAILKHLMLPYFLRCLADYTENCTLVHGMKSISIWRLKQRPLYVYFVSLTSEQIQSTIYSVTHCTCILVFN